MPQCLSGIETYILFKMQDDYFLESLLTTFEASTIFLGNWGCTKYWLKHKIKPSNPVMHTIMHV
jgi:hypothetical protein